MKSRVERRCKLVKNCAEKLDFKKKRGAGGVAYLLKIFRTS